MTLCLSAAGSLATSASPDTVAHLEVPLITPAPTLDDFQEMEPSPLYASQLARVDGFVQQRPRDGEPASQGTVAYLCHDGQRLIIIFAAFDTEPEAIRARLTRRDSVMGDDFVEITLDTFRDQRRGYVFAVNSMGMQTDALWTEGSGSNFDQSFDTVWESHGRLTEQGYLVWVGIPFKSLRFKNVATQSWGITLSRNSPRLNEWSYWPRVSSRIEGRLNQAATMRISERISPGRNIQIIPYGVFRSFRALADGDSSGARFVSDKAETDGGIDAKVVFNDKLVLDVAANPDFSQVESDEPQVTVNQRFEVFFPEKRPFFLENANFFRTPINLLFTRRIADPQFGARLTGKVGPYALGALVTDDQSPGRLAAQESPLSGKRALFNTFRVSRDISTQSTLGFLYTGREFEKSYNRVAAVDGRFKFNENWDLSFQAATSSTQFKDETRSAGPAYNLLVNRTGRQFQYSLVYADFSPGFVTQTGFVRRTDIRSVNQEVDYKFRPEGERLIAFGPSLAFEEVWDHQGTRLDRTVVPGFRFEFMRQTNLEGFHTSGRERLRPQDAPNLTAGEDFPIRETGFSFDSNYFSKVGVNLFWSWGKGINFVPAHEKPPAAADTTTVDFGLTLRPITQLRIDNTYLFDRLGNQNTGATILNNRILRSRWNWQFSKEMSVRVILQYEATLTNQDFTFLETTRNLNVDFLFTYLVNPWTVLFVGYNSNAQNLRLVGEPPLRELVRTREGFLNDSRQFFVKFSYLFRF